MKQALKVGVSGVRGVVGDSLTPQIVMSFAQAFGAFVGSGTVVVGRDTRPSGLMFQEAVVTGLQSVGCKPLLLGVQPTPTILMQTRTVGARGGIAITASHNPGPWNALKFVDRSGMFLNRTRADELFDIYHQQDFPFVAEQDLQEAEWLESPFRLHRDRVLTYVDRECISQKRFKVAVDCCHGVGAVHTVGFLETLGCEVVPMSDEASGEFTRDPEPSPENIGALCQLVKERGCDVGFAQDPDGDRLAIVDETGEAIGEDLSVAFAIRQVLARHQAGPVVINLSASKGIEEMARGLGADVIRTPTGEINVSEKMVELGAVAGGEHTGGVIVPAIHPCRDSYSAMALVLELMACEGKAVSSLRQDVPRYSLLREKLPIRADQAPLILRSLRRHFEGEKMNLLDGVYVDFGDSWIQVRRSFTEPVMRLFSESPKEARSRELLDELKDLIQTTL